MTIFRISFKNNIQSRDIFCYIRSEHLITFFIARKGFDVKYGSIFDNHHLARWPQKKFFRETLNSYDYFKHKLEYNILYSSLCLKKKGQFNKSILTRYPLLEK